jgi:hypothetical protein
MKKAISAISGVKSRIIGRKQAPKVIEYALSLLAPELFANLKPTYSQADVFPG